MAGPASAWLQRLNVSQHATQNSRSRFGQIPQYLLAYLSKSVHVFARGYDVSIIDTDVEMIDVARELEFKVYYGDGTRLDILRAAGAAQARVVLLCVDNAEDNRDTPELNAVLERPLALREASRLKSEWARPTSNYLHATNGPRQPLSFRL